MSLDEPIDLVPTAKARAALDELAVVQVGDIVRVGKGARLWKVTGFWPSGGRMFASLAPHGGGYTSNSTTVDRLTVVERGGGL